MCRARHTTKLCNHDHVGLQDYYIRESLPITCRLKKKLGQVSLFLRAHLDKSPPIVPFLKDNTCPVNKPDMACYGPLLGVFNLDQDLSALIEKNKENPERSFRQGIVHKNGEAFFISLVPDYFAPGCIRCHSRVEDASQSLIDRYDPDGGFRFQAGDPAGIDSVAIPISASLREAWQGSLVIFIITFGGSVVLLWLLNLLFQRLVIERLGVMLSLVAEKKKESSVPPDPGDELDVLHASLGSLRNYVHSARKGSALQPNFIGNYVVTKPIAAGAMSWLYNGYGAQSDDKVALKIGFDEVLQNPLYRSCFETELQLFETVSHPCLPEVRERITDVLVLEEIRGKSLISHFNRG